MASPDSLRPIRLDPGARSSKSRSMSTYSDSEKSSSLPRRTPTEHHFRLNLHSLEVYFKDGRSARLLKTSHDKEFFSDEDWIFFQKRAVSFLKKEVKTGEAKAFRLGQNNELGCHMISWTNGLSSICITSRSDSIVPVVDDNLTRTCLAAEGRLLTRVLDNCLRKLPAEMWSLETRVFVDDQRIKYYEGHLNMILQEEMDDLYRKKLAISRGLTMKKAISHDQIETKSLDNKEWAQKQERYQMEFARKQANISGTTLLKRKIVKWFEERA